MILSFARATGRDRHRFRPLSVPADIPEPHFVPADLTYSEGEKHTLRNPEFAPKSRIRAEMTSMECAIHGCRRVDRPDVLGHWRVVDPSMRCIRSRRKAFRNRKGTDILARLPVGWLVALAVLATCVLCLGVQRCLGTRGSAAKAAGLSLLFLLLMTVMGGVGAVPWNARQMVVMYSFTWVGFTIGAIPSGRLLRAHLRAGTASTSDRGLVVPTRHLVIMCVTLSLALLLAYVLAT
ncbi:hypothetical protein ACIBEA_15030 [Streptomyces sp. NPDC051555]|uniref:hypothetical protein n=1 Tax=Streptomyces sp. NPDC051555 TaxID=3365657 RepID=UPI00379E1DD0